LNGVLHNFLGTYTSRYSDYNGYWLFGFLVRTLDVLEFDWLTEFDGRATSPNDFSQQLAISRFAEQIHESGLDAQLVHEAYLRIERIAERVVSPVNGRPAKGFPMRFTAQAKADTGKQFSRDRTLFVAPHSPWREYRSSQKS